MDKQKQSDKRITFWKVLETIATIFLFLILLPIIISILPIENNIEIFSIQSGSMEPTIHVGSLAISKPMGTYEANDIIAFQPNGEDIITHRILEISYTTGKVVTKGDANEESDKETITPAKIKGKIIFWLPLAGYVVNFSKTLPGFIILIIIPAIIIISDELVGIVKELKNQKNKKAANRLTQVDKEKGESK